MPKAAGAAVYEGTPERSFDAGYKITRRETNMAVMKIVVVRAWQLAAGGV
jgi:hypothetical protein